MKIITVTINPSLDHTLRVNFLSLGYHNQTMGPTFLTAAGRGMVLARALHSLQVPVETVALLGDDPESHAYEAAIRAEGLPVHIVRYDGVTRSNMILIDQGNNTETIIKEEGSPVSQETLQKVADLLVSLIEPQDFVVFPGSLPRAVPETTYGWFTEIANKAGARVVLHTESDILRAALPAKPQIVVLTQLQVERFFNFPVRMPEDVVYCASKLLELGAARAIILLASNKGALLASAEGTLLVEFPEDAHFGTSSGSLEALTAGYLAGRLKQRPLDKALQIGGAAALYSATQVGAEFATPSDLKEHLRAVNVHSA
jgi:1-phosphofructokinase family hexose kinase